MRWRSTALLNVDLKRAAWRKSSYSGGDGAECIEVAPGFLSGVVPVRDSKDSHGPALVFRAAAWEAFVVAVRSGEFPA
ncbi:DUF397 domain-containing protein [Kitasatospora xanthocidica]|uniref:DUF397 domain-containing protein n=1 Tax=Kitasatospora xanthocidica TaxID=83382 RepID=A0A372ZQV7_9ACTN|nr:DUF397 domain-containing protein [Kitasatospora xanthocidica]